MSSEIAISSSGLKDSLVHCWDIRTGVLLHSIKGNTSSHAIVPVPASWASPSWLLSVQKDKALIHVYSTGQKSVAAKWVLMEELTALECSPSGEYCVGGGLSGRLYLWHIPTGRMACMWDAHYAKVSVVKFTCDGQRIISGGYDSAILIFDLRELLSGKTQDPSRITLSGHSLPITALYISQSLTPRIFSASTDKCIKIWDMDSTCLGTIILPSSLTTLAINTLETQAFVGCVNGSIFTLDLYSTELDSTMPLDPLQYVGHTMAITELKLSMDESLLVSASEDGDCIVWDPYTRQKLRTFNQGSTVSGLTICLAPQIPVGVMPPFRRFVEKCDTLEVTLEAVERTQVEEVEDLEGKVRSLMGANEALYNAVLGTLNK